MKNKSIIVLDTNVILFDVLSVKRFFNSKVCIPFKVIEEIDKFKREHGETGRNARHFSRFMDVLRGKGSLAEGVYLEDCNITIVVVVADETIRSEASKMQSEIKNDNLILATAISLCNQYSDYDVKLVTKDINLRIKSDIYGVVAEDYELTHAESDELYAGITTVDVTAEQIEQLYILKHHSLKGHTFLANQYVAMVDKANENNKALGRYDVQKGEIVALHTLIEGVWGIHPKNMEQSFALDSLLNDEIGLVTLSGKAGTGKTLLALAVGLHKTLDESRYQKLLVSRPIFPMGKDIGYLPGDVEQKLNPWMQPIFDNIDFLMGSDKKSTYRTTELMSQGMISIEPLTYIRGRSIPKQFLIVDEAQNLTPHEIKTIITRSGQGTKVILTGDVYQIDNPYLDFASSGLTYVGEKFKNQSISAHVTLQKGERSLLAELASNIL